jgi:hypothetical protein
MASKHNGHNNEKTHIMKAPKKSGSANYVAVAGTDDEPVIYCPACGKEILLSEEECPHVLFVCEQRADIGYTFNYVHPKLKNIADAVQKEFRQHWEACQEKDTEYSEDSSTLASRFHLDLRRALVLSVTTKLADIAGGSFWETIVGIEFPAESEELKRFRAENS